MLHGATAQEIVERNRALNDPFAKPQPPAPGATDPLGPGHPSRTGPVYTYLEWAQIEPQLDLHTSAFLVAYGSVTFQKMDIDTVYLQLAALNIHPPPPSFLAASADPAAVDPNNPNTPR